MKKIVLIFLILITTSSKVCAENLFSRFFNHFFFNPKKEENYPTKTRAESIFDILEEDAVSDKDREEIPSEDEKKDILSDDAKKTPLSGSVKKDELQDKLPAKLQDKSRNITKEDPLSEVSEINAMRDDEQKIKKWEKLNSNENYVVINKKECLATVYNKYGDEIKSFEIGIGRDIGDDYNDTSGLLGKAKNTTPAGEYTLITNIINPAAYGDLTLSLGEKANKAHQSKKVVALHKVPKFRARDRLNKFNDGNLANNRMSHGCINFLETDFNELRKYIHGGLKVYILPEEADNQLMLEKNDKGKFEFVQTKYRII